MNGWVYILHFDKPYPRDTRGAVRHYVGYSQLTPQHRLETHTSPLVRAAKASGIRLIIGYAEPGTRTDERHLKNQRHAERYCHICTGKA